MQLALAYDPYGRATILAPDWSERPASLFAWQHLHQGLRFDPLTGLYHNRAREYSPSLMRFVSTDPIWATNLYAAYGIGPTGRVDPTGLGWGQRFLGAPKLVGGIHEISAGTALAGVGTLGTIFSGGVAAPVSIPAAIGGGIVSLHGLDVAVSGAREIWTGEPKQTLTEQGIQWVAEQAGATEDEAKEMAAWSDLGISLIGTVGTGFYRAIPKAVQTAGPRVVGVLPHLRAVWNPGWLKVIVGPEEVSKLVRFHVAWEVGGKFFEALGWFPSITNIFNALRRGKYSDAWRGLLPGMKVEDITHNAWRQDWIARRWFRVWLPVINIEMSRGTHAYYCATAPLTGFNTGNYGIPGWIIARLLPGMLSESQTNPSE